MAFVNEHIQRAADWQLEQGLEELRAIYTSTKNTVVKNIAGSYMGTISFELHGRKQKTLSSNDKTKD